MAGKVITDSTSCIPKDLAEKYGVEIVSLSVIMNGESYKEVDIDSEAFYDELAKCDKIPTSSQPPMDEFIMLLKNLLRMVMIYRSVYII